uniref:hypothetical protein n=1 Tax=Methanobrevibacter smithii TaxID=2173 RepID=UPI0037DDBB3A
MAYYNPYGYNPMINQQNRLQQLEMQNQQQQMLNNQMMNQGMNNQTQQQFIKCRPVSSIEEAKASMIDLDGTLSVFLNISNEEIYTKQITLNGTPNFEVYRKAPILAQNDSNVSINIELLNNKIKSLEDKIEALEREVNKYDESITNVRSNISNSKSDANDITNVWEQSRNEQSDSNESR